MLSRSSRKLRRSLKKSQSEIAGGIGTDPVVIEAARLKLANAVLSVASDDSRDVEALTRATLQAMARSSRP